MKGLSVRVKSKAGQIVRIQLNPDGNTSRSARDFDGQQSLRSYVAGRLNGTVTLDWSLLATEDVTDFQRSVYAETARISAGERRTYEDIAEALENPGASRAVGQALGRNPVPLVVPCHRVVRSDGTLGGFAGSDDSSLKRRLLDLESRSNGA